MLMLPAPPPQLGGALASRLGAVEDDDADFQRQLAAAMAASIQSAEEDSLRRKHCLPTAAPPAAALPSVFPGMASGLYGGAGVYATTAPSLPANASVCNAWAATGPAALAADTPPTGLDSTAAGGLGAGLQRGGAYNTATRQSSAPLPELALVPSLLAGPPPGSPVSSTAASAGGSGPSSPVTFPAAAQHIAAHQPACHKAAAIPPRPAAAVATAAAASLLLSASPGKHGRTPSHTSLPEASQPHMKRSRPASDSGAGAGVSAFGVGAGLQATAESSGAGVRLGGGAMGAGAGSVRVTSSGLSGHLAARRLGEGDAADPNSGGGGGVRGTWTDLRGRCASVAAADLIAGAHGESPPTRPASAASGCNPAALAEASAAVSLAAIAAASSGERQGLVPLDLSGSFVGSRSLAPPGRLHPHQHQLSQHQHLEQQAHAAFLQLRERSGSVAADGGSGLRGAVAALDLSRPALRLEQLLQRPHQAHQPAAEVGIPLRRAASLTTIGLQAVAEPMSIDTAAQPPQPLPLPDAAEGAADGTAVAEVPAFDGAADRRLLQHQRVWWWLGPSQAQLGRVISIDRRSNPLLYSVRLDAPAGSGGEGEVVIATADCLLPFVMFGEAVMCRLEAAPDLESANEAEGQADVEADAAHIAPASARSCAWARGVLQHCVFDGPVPAVHVLLQQRHGAALCTVPYAAVVPCADAAEGSGISRGFAGGAVENSSGVGAWELQRYDSTAAPHPAFGASDAALGPVPWVQQWPVAGSNHSMWGADAEVTARPSFAS